MKDDGAGPPGVAEDYPAEVLKDFYTDVQIAKLMGNITLSTLNNKIYSGYDHPPFVPGTKPRLFPKAEFYKWALANAKHARKRRAS